MTGLALSLQSDNTEVYTRKKRGRPCMDTKRKQGKKLKGVHYHK